mgnify:CR=1 FL=1
MKKTLYIIALLALSACSSSDQATRALQAAGYKDINITGYSFFGCDEKDSFHTGFEATGPNGQRVDGVVCSGWFKGATIRTN